MRFDITKEDSEFLLADSMPEGRLWEGCFDASTNLGRFTAALAVEYYRLSLLMQKLSDEMDIRKTNDLLIEWEQSVGIPNDYFKTTASLERRRQQVEQLFSNFGGVQENADFVRVADFFGFEIIVKPGADFLTFPLTFPIMFSGSTGEAGHTIFVHIVGGSGVVGEAFPLPFPIPFSEGGQPFLRLIFEILIPANVQLIFY